MQKIKQWATSDIGKDISVVIIVILVGLSSFGLGRLSVATRGSGLKVMYPPALTEVQTTSQPANVLSATKPQTVYSIVGTNNSSKKFFASSRGQKFYGINCAAGKNIKPENRIYFDTKDEAKKAGYELSNSCR